MNEDTQNDERQIVSEKNNNVTYALIGGLVIIIAGVAYWQLSQFSTVASMDQVPVVENTPVNGNQVSILDKPTDSVSDLPPTVAVEEDVQPAKAGEDFGLAEVSATFISPRTVVDAVIFYTAEIKEKGGTINSTMRTPDKEIIVATTADGKPYIVYIGEKDGATVVTINVDPAQ